MESCLIIEKNIKNMSKVITHNLEVHREKLEKKIYNKNQTPAHFDNI